MVKDPNVQFRSVLYSLDYEDHYASVDEDASDLVGIREKKQVFVNPILGLFGKKIHILEVGFGRGLNFLLCLQYAKKMNSFIHYTSFENTPLSKDILSQEWDHIQDADLKCLAKELLSKLPPRLSGFHRVSFLNAALDLYYGDALTGLTERAQLAHVCFLDGFSPQKNPSAWSELLLSSIVQSLNSGGIVLSYSVAKSVTETLAKLGLSIHKREGFGKKKQALQAVKQGKLSFQKSSRVLIVGAGAIGLTLYEALKKRECDVTIIDEQGAFAGASGNPYAACMPSFSKRPTLLSALSIRAVSMIAGHFRDTVGAFHYPQVKLDYSRFEESAKWMNELDPFLVLKDDYAFTPLSHYFSPPSLVEPETVQAVIQASLSKKWMQEFDQIVYATGYRAPFGVKIVPKAGQVIIVELLKPMFPLVSFDGYAIGYSPSEVLIGSTFRSKPILECEISENDSKRLLENAAFLPITNRILSSRVSVRGTLSDHLPLVGQFSEQVYFSLAHGSKGVGSALFFAEYSASDLCHEPKPLTDVDALRIHPSRLDLLKKNT